ncbi:dynein heavy chain 1, cytosolic [Phakopsora pachyrhizi]|nr:dynein heavy chain 1, cytosolic [Phakopsora pachyrhizi]
MSLCFVCDKTFVFQAMGRIYVGLCLEADRLKERILCVVSQQIQKTLTMNPGYKGQNLRRMAMTRPDRAHIPQAMIFSQGILTTETLASKIAQFFSLRSVQLLKQPHYDFGFKSLKAVSISAAKNSEQSVRETLVPKLVAEDIPLLNR